MSPIALKKQLHKAIDEIIDNSILEAVYTLLNNTINDEVELSARQKKELNKRLSEHKQGKLKYYSLSEVKSAALKNLKK